MIKVCKNNVDEIIRCEECKTHFNIYCNKKDEFIGMFYKVTNGFFVYTPALRVKYWESAMAQAIALKLDELNEPIEKQMKCVKEKGY